MNMYLHAYIDMYTHTYIYIYICVCVCLQCKIRLWAPIGSQGASCSSPLSIPHSVEEAGIAARSKHNSNIEAYPLDLGWLKGPWDMHHFWVEHSSHMWKV